MSFLQTNVTEKSSVQVAVRVRPLNKREEDSKVIISTNANTITIKNPDSKEKKIFTYDHTYDSSTTQETVFNDIGNQVIDNVFKGYNTCVFAYGQTGSGKTHTMMGSDQSPGLIPRICKSLFDRQSTHNSNNIGQATINYKIELSYLEIYAEEVRDLLSPSAVLRIREHPELGPYVEGLSHVLVENHHTINHLINKGNRERMTAATLMNAHSSRSHAILTLHFTQLIDEPDIGKTREVVSKINLVDLAGSERVESSGVTGINFTEAITINKSLSTLGLVISKLAEQAELGGKSTLRSKSVPKIIKSRTSTKPTAAIKKKKKDTSVNNLSTGTGTFIPFRNSVLTWILSESLGGNSKTFMLAAISPASINYNESLNTLRYAKNAKKIINTVKVNEDPNDKLIRILKDEIDILKIQLSNSSGGSVPTEALRKLQDEINQREDLMREKDKSWEQKFEESRILNETVQSQLKLEMSLKQEEIQTLLSKNQELVQTVETIKEQEETRIKLIKEQEEVRIKLIEEEKAKFEKECILGTAVSLQEYYETRIDKIRTDYENKMQQTQSEENKQMLAELAELRKTNHQLKTDLDKNQSMLQHQLGKFTNDRILLSKQIQQLHSKIHSLEQDISKPDDSNLADLNKLRELREQEEAKIATLQEQYNSLSSTIESNKKELTVLESKHAEIIQEIEFKSEQLEELKLNYSELMTKFEADKKEYDILFAKKESLRFLIDSALEDFNQQLSTIKSIPDDTSNLQQIQDGLNSILEKMKRI